MRNLSSSFVIFRTALICLAVIFIQHTTWSKGPTQTESTSNELSFRIEDSRCFVGIAPVYLSVSELTREGDNLVGTYRIDVPMKKSKNDFGRIVLPVDASVNELGTKGGVLKGTAHSEVVEGITNLIVCEIFPHENQMIKLAITTKDRTIKFKSNYTVIDTGAVESDS